MKRSADAAILVFVCLVLISSMGCGGRSSKPSTTTVTPTPETFAITATSGSGQSTASGTPFSTPLVATVTASGIRMSGIKVAFTAPASGPSGIFANGTATDVEITDAAGKATSSVFTANSSSGNFTVTATVSGAPKPVPFALTTLAPVVNTSYVFYASGEETSSAGFYALAGSVTLDANGKVVAGVQDYNDGSTVTSPQPSGDTIQGGSLSFPTGAPSGQGILTLITNNPGIGVPNSDGVTSTETFGIQFVNASHALIMQFDGSATTSGSLDLQTLTGTLSGGYAFTFSGIDNGSAFSFGGVFSVSGSNLTGTIDINDFFNVGQVITGMPLSGQLSTAAGGRGTITGFNNAATATPVALNYYIVGPNTIRIIDVDVSDTAVGSAFSQATGTFSNASLGASVLAIAGNLADQFGALGQFTTTNTSSATSNFSGVGEDSEPANGIGTAPASKFSGTYTIGSNGYGNLLFKIDPNTLLGFGNIGHLGIYMTDPTLNLNDPNNPAGGGGGLIMDLDDFSLTSGTFPGGTGLIIPQTDITSASFNGNYAAGWQDLNFNFCGCEFDMIAQGTMVANGALSLTGFVSDPTGTLAGTGIPTETQGDTFTGTPLADTKNPGRYAMTSTTDSLVTVIGGAAGPTFQMTVYQANGGQLFWLGYDQADIGNTGGGSPAYVSLGPIEQATLTGLPAARKPAAKAKANKKR